VEEALTAVGYSVSVEKPGTVKSVSLNTGINLGVLINLNIGSWV